VELAAEVAKIRGAYVVRLSMTEKPGTLGPFRLGGAVSALFTVVLARLQIP
jgi:hypothetical protein